MSWVLTVQELFSLMLTVPLVFVSVAFSFGVVLMSSGSPPLFSSTFMASGIQSSLQSILS